MVRTLAVASRWSSGCEIAGLFFRRPRGPKARTAGRLPGERAAAVQQDSCEYSCLQSGTKLGKSLQSKEASLDWHQGEAIVFYPPFSLPDTQITVENNSFFFFFHWENTTVSILLLRKEMDSTILLKKVLNTETHFNGVFWSRKNRRNEGQRERGRKGDYRKRY